MEKVDNSKYRERNTLYTAGGCVNWNVSIEG